MLKYAKMSNFYQRHRIKFFEIFTFVFCLEEKTQLTANYYLYECKYIIMKELVYPPNIVSCLRDSSVEEKMVNY